MIKRILSIMVAITMIFSMIPIVSHAEEAPDTVVDEEPGGEELSEEECQARAAFVMAKIDDLLTRPLTREAYEIVKNAFEGEPDEVQAYYNLEKVNCFNQLHELMDAADKAIVAVGKIHPLPISAKEDDYITFADEFEGAQSVVNYYEGRFSECKSRDVFSNCLPTIVKKTLVDNYGDYERAKYYYDVEQAYFNIGDFSVMTSDVAEKVDSLKKALAKASNSEFTLTVYDFFNGYDIKALIDQTETILQFEQDVDILPETISNIEDMAAMMRAYETYSNMKEEDKAKIADEYVERLMEAVHLSLEAEDVMERIAEIGILESAEDFDAFSDKYEKAYRAYQTFIAKHSEISGVDELIENTNLLNEETIVLEMVKKIRKFLNTADVLMCSQLIQMEQIRISYQGMSDKLKQQIYNYEEFLGVYEDAKKASEVGAKIESIRANFMLEDEKKIEQIRAEYDSLTDRQKSYVGESKAEALVLIEQQLDALNKNEAQKVVEKIEAIGSVKVNSKKKIEAARQMYDGLSDKQKELVANYATLLEAEKKYETFETSLTKATIAALGSYIYTNNPVEPEVCVILNQTVLQEGVDYIVTYKNNEKVGTAKAVIKGIGNYSGSVTKTFTISCRTISAAKVSGIKTSYTYKGSAIKPSVKLTLGTKSLKKGTDYTISFKKNTAVGTASVTIKGIGNYKGTLKESFKIKRKSIKKASIAGVKKYYECTGKGIYPKMTVKVGKRILKKGKDYSIYYVDNVARGKAYAVLTGKGNYKGTRKVKYKIV